MDQLTLVTGAASLSDEQYFRDTLAKIITTRERVKRELSALGFTMPDSKSNFLFISHPRVSAKELFTALRGQNIFVRYFDQPRIENMLRVTIGTDGEMNRLITFLKEYLC